MTLKRGSLKGLVGKKGEKKSQGTWKNWLTWKSGGERHNMDCTIVAVIFRCALIKKVTVRDGYLHFIKKISSFIKATRLLLPC